MKPQSCPGAFFSRPITPKEGLKPLFPFLPISINTLFNAIFMRKLCG